MALKGKKKDVRPWQSSADVNQHHSVSSHASAPIYCSWQTSLRVRERYWSRSKSTGNLHFTNEIIWPLVTWGSADRGFWPKTQLRSGVAAPYTAAKISLFQGIAWKVCDWQPMNRGSLTSNRKTSPSHISLPPPDFPVPALRLSKTLVWISRDLPRGHLWLVPMMQDGCQKMIPDLPQPKEVTQRYRCLSDFWKAVWVNVSTRLDFHFAIENDVRKASPWLHTI